MVLACSHIFNKHKSSLQVVSSMHNVTRYRGRSVLWRHRVNGEGEVYNFGSHFVFRLERGVVNISTVCGLILVQTKAVFLQREETDIGANNQVKISIKNWSWSGIFFGKLEHSQFSAIVFIDFLQHRYKKDTVVFCFWTFQISIFL